MFEISQSSVVSGQLHLFSAANDGQPANDKMSE